MNNLSVKYMFIAMAASVLILMLAIGGIGQFSAGKMESAMRHSVAVTAAVRQQMDADMMHDTIKADVFSALLAARESDAERIKASSAELESHAIRLKKNIEAISQADLGEAVRKQADAVRPNLERYTATAHAIIQTLINGGEASSEHRASFQHDFEALEQEMEALSDLIQKVSESATDMTSEAMVSNRWATGGIVLIALIVLLALTPVLFRRIVRPLTRLADVAQNTRASGDLTLRAPACATKEIGQTVQAFNALLERFQAIVGQVQSESGQVSEAATQLAATSAQVAQAASDQNETAASTAAGVEQMAVSVASVADSAEEVRKVSNESLDRTGKGIEGLSDLNTRFKGLEGDVEAIADSVRLFVESTNSITAMTQQVSAIADQTNLLALNAAIEAARAGEHGRGFAVVADEVRKLAEQSRKHAAEIDSVTQQLGQKSSHLVQTIDQGLNSLRGSREVMDSMGSALQEVGHAVTSANRGVDEITASVREQRSVTSEIARNMEQIAQKSEESSAAVKESADAARHLERLSTNLQTAVSGFRV